MLLEIPHKYPSAVFEDNFQYMQFIYAKKWRKNFGTFFAVFKPFIGNKTLQKIFYLVEEVQSFDLVGHM